MFTTGSKLLIGSAVVATICAVVYGVTQEGALGTIGLISAAVALSMLAAINVFVRDSNVWATDDASFQSSAAAQTTAGNSVWPLLIGIGAAAVTLGLVTYEAIFVLGVIILLAGAVEWMIQAWSERASADGDYNSYARELMADPFELPVAAAAGAAIIVYAFSRIMLGLPSKTASVVAFAVVAAMVLIVGVVIMLAQNVSRGVKLGMFSIAVIALITGGAFAGLSGERETHEHHTPGDLAEEDDCGPDETEADERASQTVAAKSSVAAEVTLEDGALVGTVQDFSGNFDELTFPRSNPSNVLFHNNSDDHARLVIELHPALDDDGEPIGPERLCTALVDAGGTQLLTIEFDQPSFAVEGGYAFTVPGTDAELGVVVP